MTRKKSEVKPVAGIKSPRGNLPSSTFEYRNILMVVKKYKIWIDIQVFI